MKKDPAVYIRHIHDCILRIEAYVEEGRAENVLAHQYLGVDLDLVWNIVDQNLPSLKTAIHETADRLAIDLPERGDPN